MYDNLIIDILNDSQGIILCDTATQFKTVRDTNYTTDVNSGPWHAFYTGLNLRC